jgi:hypothetical protein
MASRQLLVDPHKLEPGELQAALLEPRENWADQAALDGIGFQDNQ